MKKAFLGALASLMLAGAISAASGLSTTNPTASMAVMLADGTAPLPASAVADDRCDSPSQNK